MITAPSIKTLLASGICNKLRVSPLDAAKKVRAIIHGIEGHHDDTFVGFHKMRALNELLECHGVEAVGDFNNFPPVCHFEYVNTGDTYAPTIIRFPGGRYIVSSWGDEAERLERNGVKIP